MARRRARHVPQKFQVHKYLKPHKPVPHEPEEPKMSQLEEKLCLNEAYRNAYLLPIFAVGMSKGAGTYVKPATQCRSGMAQVVKFTCDNKLHCGEPDIEDAAAELAIQIGSQVQRMAPFVMKVEIKTQIKAALRNRGMISDTL